MDIELPGPAIGLRGDRYGQWLLVRPATGDSAWVVDVGKSRHVGTVQVEWDADLPARGPQHALIPGGARMWSRSTWRRGVPAPGRIEGGAGDGWLPLAWHPAPGGGHPGGRGLRGPGRRGRSAGPGSHRCTSR